MGEDVENARNASGSRQIHAGNAAPGDGGRDEEGLGDVGDRLVGWVARAACDLGAAVDAQGRLTNGSGLNRSHLQISISAAWTRARSSVRRPSSGLNALSPCVCACANAASAAALAVAR